MDTIVDTIRRNIKRLMIIRGNMTEAELARISGVDPRTINRLLSPDELPNPTIKVLSSIANKLGSEVWMLNVPDFPYESLKAHNVSRISPEGYVLLSVFEQASKGTKIDILKHMGYLISQYDNKNDEARIVQEIISTYSATPL